MAVNVFQSQKQKEDPLDKLVKLTSIGASAASIASKAGGGATDAAAAGDQGEAMTRRLDEIKEQNQSAVDNSIFTDTPKPPKSRFGLGMKYGG